MSSDADLHDQLVAIFGAEVSERVQAMNRHLLALEEDSDGAELDEQLAGLFREAHSLKGAAGAVGMTEVAAIAHRLESVFQAVRNGELTLQRSGFDVLYAGVDAIGALVTAEGAAQVDPATVVTALDRLASSRPDPLASDAPAPLASATSALTRRARLSLTHPVVGPPNGRVTRSRKWCAGLSTAPYPTRPRQPPHRPRPPPRPRPRPRPLPQRRGRRPSGWPWPSWTR